MNPYLILSPIGMIIVGLISIIYWKQKNKVKLLFFSWGALLWLIAIISKAVIDFTIMLNFFELIQSLAPSLLVLITSIIIGLRTGFFESGISYLMLKEKFKSFKWGESIAIGIGFGASEAIVLGLLSLISMILLMNPSFTASLGEEELALVQAQLNQETIIIFAPWIERLFTLLAHVFATILVIKSIQLKNKRYLWFSIAYKSVLDAPIPFFQQFIIQSVLATYLVELYIITMGLIGFYGIKWVKKLKD